jgi:selenocysteine lyase/cysteine desulfurase
MLSVKSLPSLENHETVRAAFPVLADGVYLNIGTYGIMPEPALSAFLALVEEYERRGLFSTSGVGQKVQQTRETLAQILGCAETQIAFTGNATDGTNLVLAGMTWRDGDEVITTDEEHPSIIHPLLYLQCSKGIRMRQVQVSPDPEVMRQRCAEVVSERTRLLAFSHVTCETGTRLPAAAMCAWAREQGILSLVDGAQSFGVFETKVDALGCDFYTANGHKWMCGPKGTGVFYASPERMDELSPAHIGAGSLECADVDGGMAALWTSGRRFEFGTRAHTLYAGLGYSLAWLEALGWENIERYIARLSDYLKACIMARSYLRLLTPEPFAQASGLTSFVMDGWEAGELSRALAQRSQIRVRVVPHYNAIRIATAHFNNEADVDVLMATLDALAEEVEDNVDHALPSRKL